MNISPYVTSLIRTWVPMAVGLAITFVVHWLNDTYGYAFSIDTTQAAAVAVTVVSGAYYGIVRWLEAKYPKLGWLLGTPTPPSY